ncbi:hypothetical protein V1512DRAFT_50920 [Lipomyces arxii]|uniref:uncharacterized protein n=1 Tax=Lipomyces arxii TaxID=56418 RepID=UPI0034CF3311
MVSSSSNVETSAAKDFSLQLDNIFGLGSTSKSSDAESSVVKSSSQLLDQGRVELGELQKQLAETEARLRRNKEEYQKRQAKAHIKSATAAEPEQAHKPHTSTASSVSTAQDSIANPKSRPASNAHTVSSIESGVTQSSTNAEQSRKPNMTAMLQGLKLHNRHDSTNSPTETNGETTPTSGSSSPTSATVPAKERSRKTSATLKLFGRHRTSSLGQAEKSPTLESASQQSSTSDDVEASIETSHRKFSWKKFSDEKEAAIAGDVAKMEEAFKSGARKVSSSKALPSWMKKGGT